jgi:hypothetical protein
MFLEWIITILSKITLWTFDIVWVEMLMPKCFMSNIKNGINFEKIKQGAKASYPYWLTCLLLYKLFLIMQIMKPYHISFKVVNQYTFVWFCNVCKNIPSLYFCLLLILSQTGGPTTIFMSFTPVPVAAVLSWHIPVNFWNWNIEQFWLRLHSCWQSRPLYTKFCFYLRTYLVDENTVTIKTFDFYIFKLWM